MTEYATWPNQTSWWGELVSSQFGGRFEVLALEGDVRVPVLIGGALGGAGFCCGHIGYGGVLAAGSPISLGAQLTTIRSVEQMLGLPCVRLMPPPGTPGVEGSQSTRETTLIDLTDADAQWDGYAGSVRTAIRKCQRGHLVARELTHDQACAAARLIRETQHRVGSAYLTPVSIIEAIVSAGSHLALSVGCFLGQELVSVGVFLRHAGKSVYLYNGWNLTCSNLAPNYLMVHTAVRRCAELGDHVMDLGFSHRQSLRDFKNRWGGRPVIVADLRRPTICQGI